MKEVLLSAAIAVSPGAETPQLDVQPCIQGIDEVVDFSQETPFFRKMVRRAENNPNQYFTIQEIGPDDKICFYYPDGIGTAPRAGYRDSQAFFVGRELDGIPSGVQYALEVDTVFLDLGEDGTLQDDNGKDLFTYKEMKQHADKYFDDDIDAKWDRIGYQAPNAFSAGNPARVEKQIQEEQEWIEGFPVLQNAEGMTSDQNGVMVHTQFHRTVFDIDGNEL